MTRGSAAVAAPRAVEVDPAVVPESRPRALIVTVYGLYAREAGGWMSVATLIRLLGRLGVEEAAVRSATSRLKRRGILEAERVDGVAGYALSASARRILEAGDRRIFSRPPARRSDGWVVVVFSVPESERQHRHRLRSSLVRLGFGSVSPGVWIAPWHREPEAREVLRQEDLDAYVDVFRAQHEGFGRVEEEVAQWWDLERLDALYRQFHEVFTPTIATWRAHRGRDDAGQAFADLTLALTAWRRLPFLDPGLPRDLLPQDWAGDEAAELFQTLQRRLKRPAHRFADDARGAG